MSTKSKLSFLDELDKSPAEALRSVWWLKSDFDAHVWHYSLGHKTTHHLDWSVELDDSSLLTDSKNSALLTSLKYYLAASTEGLDRRNRRERNAIETQRQHFSSALDVIDMLLVNAKSFELAKYGLSGLNENSLKYILERYSRDSSKATSIYSYEEKASKFFLQLLEDTPSFEIDTILISTPSINHVSESILELNEINIPETLIPMVRAALVHHGFYHGHDSGGHHVNTAKVGKAILKNVLRKHLGKTRIDILSFYPYEKSYRREMDGAPVRSTGNELATQGSYWQFRAKLYSLGILHSMNLDAPPQQALQIVPDYTPVLAQTLRTRLVPSGIIFEQLKNCIEFHFKHGRTILDGYCKVARHCVENKITMDSLTDKQLRAIIGRELLDLGVVRLGLICRNGREIAATDPRKGYKTNFYKRLRANHGLLDLVAIYTGCIQFVVGALTARRLTELVNLPLRGCLDKTAEWIIVELAKTSRGLWGAREKQARPIDKLGSRMIKELQRAQRYLKKIGFISDYNSLFSTPDQLTGMRLPIATSFSYLRNLDLAFDYFETPTDSKGRRYYIRQHQLRRFFALLFFHLFDGNRANGIRWQLGHKDVEHVWRYLRETLDGATLRGAKSQYIIEEMTNGRERAYLDLADYLESKYGIADFMVLDESEADDYIQDALLKGNVSIDPEFFSDETGSKMKMVVRIIDLNQVES